MLPVVDDDAPERSTVRGTLVQGLTDGDIWRLDVFEGREYARRKVRVRVLLSKKDAGKEGGGNGGAAGDEGMGDLAQKEEDNVEGEEVEAETYIWVAGAHRLEAEEWDFAEFVKDKMKRWVGGDVGERDEGFQGTLCRHFFSMIRSVGKEGKGQRKQERDNRILMHRRR